jgi:hypothetical protein
MTHTPHDDQEEPVWLTATPKDPTRPAKTNVLELINPAVLVHPRRERIVELLNTPGRFDLRKMLPSPDTDPDEFTLDDAMVQALVTEDDGETIISICTFPLSWLGHYVDAPDDQDLPDDPEFET